MNGRFLNILLHPTNHASCAVVGFFPIVLVNGLTVLGDKYLGICGSVIISYAEAHFVLVRYAVDLIYALHLLGGQNIGSDGSKSSHTRNGAHLQIVQIQLGIHLLGKSRANARAVPPTAFYFVVIL